MIDWRILQALGVMLVGVLVTSCEPLPPRVGAPPPRSFIGVIRETAGPDVYLNGSRVRRGTSILDGDTVSTGAGSGAVVELAGGGIIQLDENTDPYFGFLREGACTLIRAFRIGQLFAQGPGICLQGEDGTEIVLSSSVNWRIANGRSTVTVTEGSVRMTHPRRIRLGRGQQITVVDGRLVRGMVTLSEAELRAVTAWRVAGWAPPVAAPPPPPPAPPPAPLPPPAPPPPSPVWVMVPDLSRQPLEGARRMLGGSGLSLGRVTERVTGQARPGTVVHQIPPAGTSVHPGQGVDVVIEGEAVLPVVPPVVGQRIDQAREVLARAGLQVGKISQELSERAAAGIVLQQSPQAGARVQPSQPVHLVIAMSGVRVPKLAGMSLGAARAVLGKQGLSVGKISRMQTSQYRPDTVINQNPRAGTLVETGRSVTVVIAQARLRPAIKAPTPIAPAQPSPRHCRVPNLMGKTLPLAERTLHGAGLKLGKMTRLESGETVSSQTPRPDATIPCGAAVDVMVGVIK